MPTHKKKHSNNKSPMKTGLSSSDVAVPNAEIFNFLDEKEELGIEEVSAGLESPKVKAWKKREKKL